MSTHQLHLNPTDVLFFKDGRPMDGASSGHGAAWPLPHVLDAALHAAMHRSQEVAHSHTPKRCRTEYTKDTVAGGIMPLGTSSPEAKTHTSNRHNKELTKDRTRLFGSLQSAGPFPVDEHEDWHFPRPADADKSGSSAITHRVLLRLPAGSSSSLPDGILPVINTQVPNKDKPEKWLNTAAYQAYLGHLDSPNDSPRKPHYLKDEVIFVAEHNIGIGIDPATNTQDGEQFYSASYLRLKNNYSLGILASCMDKGKKGDTDHNAPADEDLIETVFPNSGTQTHVIAGGQQRTATVLRKTPKTLPLPIGKNTGFTKHESKYLVRWTLLTPAIFPRLEENPEKGVAEHHGGWLPTWITPKIFTVQLKDRSKTPREKGESRKDWRERVKKQNTIAATLVAALIPKAIPVTGWSLGAENSDNDFGPKSTHLAVPAGAVYYFACETSDAATQLANALNWHGISEGSEIQNRRSTLLGEKGYGLGVCSSWTPAGIQ